MACKKHGYTNNVLCPACDLETIERETKPTLAKVAADVAAALELTDQFFGVASANQPYYWARGNHYLAKDGSNLTNPYWRCACEDWLLAAGFELCFDSEYGREYRRYVATGDWIEELQDCLHYEVSGAWQEAPARLVSAVWRRMQRRQE